MGERAGGGRGKGRKMGDKWTKGKKKDGGKEWK